jgi:hypothetical protein
LDQARLCAEARHRFRPLAADAIALPSGEPRFPRARPLDLDVVIDADPAHAPFGEDVRLDRQRLECWPVEFLEQLPVRGRAGGSLNRTPTVKSSSG